MSLATLVHTRDEDLIEEILYPNITPLSQQWLYNLKRGGADLLYINIPLLPHRLKGPTRNVGLHIYII